MCYFEECDAPGTWRPVVVLRSGGSDPGAEVRFGGGGADARTRACGAHRDSLALKDYLSPEGLDVLTRHMRERAQPIPDKKHCALRWEEVELGDDPET